MSQVNLDMSEHSDLRKS